MIRSIRASQQAALRVQMACMEATDQACMYPVGSSPYGNLFDSDMDGYHRHLTICMAAAGLCDV